MKKTNIIRFVEGFVVLPVMALGSMGSNLPASIPSIVTPHIVLSHKLNIQTVASLDITPAREATVEEIAYIQAKADAIDAYFKARNMPLEGKGATMVAEAIKNDLDWRLIAAISVRESTGGKQDCVKVDNNPFGWGSCKIGFKSNEEAIATVSRNLGGNNPRTAMHYGNKETEDILHAYNPESIVPGYAKQVISIMNTIGPLEIAPANAVATI